MEDLRTKEGVCWFVEELHKSMKLRLALSSSSFTPLACVWIQRRPETEELLETPMVVEIVCPRGTELESMVTEVRRIALRHSALGVCVVLPLLVVDDLPLSGEPVEAKPEDMHLAYMVEHMNEKIGRPLWIAKAKEQAHDNGIELGELEEQVGGALPLGALGGLLPRREMN